MVCIRYSFDEVEISTLSRFVLLIKTTKSGIYRKNIYLLLFYLASPKYFYGKMGEVTKTRRTLIVPNQAIATYVTQ